MLFISHGAHQMTFKMHPDRKNRPRFCIPARPHKRRDISDMHCNFTKTSLSLSAPSIWHHTHTIRIYHHQWVINRPWERSTWRHIMECDKPTVAPSTLTSQVRLPAWIWPTNQGRPDRSGHRGKLGLNGRIHLWHHHHYHWLPTLGGACQERSFIDNPYHIQTSAFRRTPETRWPPLTPQICRIRSDWTSQELLGMGHPYPLSTGIPTARKWDILGTRHQGIPSFKKHKYRQDRITHW